MISLSQLQTSVLRQMTGSDSKTRAHMIRSLHRKGIFAAQPDGSKPGQEEYIHEEEPKGFERLSTKSVPPVSQRTQTRTLDEGNPGTDIVPKGARLYTDARYDVLVTNHLRVKENIHFGPGYTNIRDEIVNSRTLMDEIRQETETLKSQLSGFSQAFQTDELDVPVSNKLGSFHELHVSPSTVRFKNAVFKCTRVDEMVNLYIEFLITEIDSDIIEIELPYAMRASYVPFQVILRPNDGSGEFSGMARAYGKNRNKLYVESYLFQDTLYVSIEGNYLTTFDQPYRDKPIKWITPVRYNRVKVMHLDNVSLLTEVPGSDLGFSDGYGYETRTLNRVDLALRFVFSQRTTQHVPVIRFVTHFPVLNDRVYGTHVNGYATCYLPEHRMFTTKSPRVTIQGENTLEVYATMGPLLFHDVVIQAHVSYYSTDNVVRIHPFEKPIVRSTSTLTNSEIAISDIHIYDAIHNDQYRLMNRYNVVLTQRNKQSDYDTFRPVPLQLTLNFDLFDNTLEVSRISLFNQLDQYDRRYLYPQRKQFHIKLSAINFIHEYDGPYDITPDFTQYI